MNKKVDQEERRRHKEMKEQLEKMIQSTELDLNQSLKEASATLPSKTDLNLDYVEVKDDIDFQAARVVKAVAEFYLDRNIIDNIDYVAEKVKIDHLTVSNLLFQMKTAEHGIIKLLSLIDSGDSVQPRYFEVLSSLQRSKMEIIKHMTQFMRIMEENYKEFKEFYVIKQNNETSGTEEDGLINKDGSFKTRGTRSMLMAIEELNSESSSEEEDIDN